ncbi:hypothetical protein DSO57_1032036 [Entomophthora muscae]|uniref:Uncharacterized protein n=1 Tax=Entomophthora muscae TaxID=34485 RepID=A0ACC2RF93_9FUNG|nr:hypothetical protein DSO57_1032036 [Entomophthora muscae]
MNWLPLQEVCLFGFLTLRNSLAHLMLVASDSTVLGRKYKSNPKVRIPCCVSVPRLRTQQRPSLDQWRAKAQEIEHKWIAGGIKHLSARYATGDPVYTLNPNPAKLEPNHLGPFKVAAVYDNHTYQLEDAQGNTKKLHHDRLRPCCAIPTQRLFVQTFPDLPQTPILVSDDKQGARGGVATKFLGLPAKISYNTQGALGELPLDVSNVMD